MLLTTSYIVTGASGKAAQPAALPRPCILLFTDDDGLARKLGICLQEVQMRQNQAGPGERSQATDTGMLSASSRHAGGWFGEGLVLPADSLGAIGPLQPADSEVAAGDILEVVYEDGVD